MIIIASAALLTLAGISIPAARADGRTDSRLSSPLTYHGGPVMTKVKNYLVFWNGGDKKAFDKKYVALLQRWQKDARYLAVFRTTMQYTQADGQHPTDTTYGATYTDSTPFPRSVACANRCVDGTDVVEIAEATATAHKIKPGLGTIMYVYTPMTVRWCKSVDIDNVDCDGHEGDFGGECGVRRVGNINGKPLIVIYVDYVSSPCWWDRDGGSQRFPNDKAADAAINITSHYQMEAITDPLFSGWREDKDEVVGIASECKGIFGPRLPGRKGNSYYRGHTYDVQAQASNAAHGCVVDSRIHGF